jgi:hypothetical protein
MTACAIGLLPLTKGSFSGVVSVESIIAFAILLQDRQIALAVCMPLISVLSLCIGWVATGQPLSALGHFFITQQPLIAGYSEAMAWYGPVSQMLYWLIAAVAACGFFYASATRPGGKPELLALCGLVLYLFVAFKAGFVRQDIHPILAATSLPFAALAISAFLRLRQALVLGLIMAAGWLAIEFSVGAPTFFFLDRVRTALESMNTGLINRATDPQAVHRMFADGNASIRKASPLHDIRGTVDLYPWDLSVLFANGLSWSGRPVLQSYTVYRPQLDQADVDHLNGPDAPDNVLFTFYPIDNRLPSLEDALSWPVLLRNYTIVARQGAYLHMSRTSQPRPSTSIQLADFDTSIGQPIAVPPTDGLIVARIQMRTTIVGKAALAILKLPEVSLEVTSTSGKSFTFRYIPEMGETGFVLSPLVNSLDDFAAMASGTAQALRVRQVRLKAPAAGVLWSENVHVTFNSVRMAPHG